MSATAALHERLAELADLAAASRLLHWDQQTIMPAGAVSHRGELTVTLDRIAHQRQTDPALGELIDAAAAEAQTDRDHAVARVARRDFDHESRIPVELVTALARETAAAVPAWAAARRASDFTHFRPHLERIVALKHEVAACTPGTAHPYDALLDTYEPGATTATLRAIFAELREGLVPLVAELAQAPAPAPLSGPFPVDGQRALALEIARAIGFDESGWRIDDAVHPFAASVTRTDIRVTSRWNADDLSGIFAVIHEMGHGLYEAGIGPDLDRSTLDTGVSLGIHESQSRIWENHVGRSASFWQHWLPRAQELLPTLRGLDLETFMRAVNVVQPTLIRVEADEATYALHVILRFELEVALIEGTLAVADLPAAWNERVRASLGIEVPDDAHGCLQDVHWAWGELGYFPTYTLGDMGAAQLWDAAAAALPGLEGSLAGGDCAPLRDWLGEHVHRHGRTLDPPDLMRRATGAPLSAEPLLRYLGEKYRGLYGL